MPIFGYSEREMEAARRKARSAVMDQLLAQVRYHRGHDEGRKILLETVEKVRGHSQLADALVALIDQLVERSAGLERQLDHERARRKQLQGQLEEAQRPSLLSWTFEVIEERNRWQEEATALRQRVQQLEEALERRRATHQSETRELQARIGELNRIVVEQEQRLNAFRN